MGNLVLAARITTQCRFFPVLAGSFLLRSSLTGFARPVTGLNHPAFLLQIGNSMHFGGGALPPGGGERPYRKTILLGKGTPALLLKIAIRMAGGRAEKEMAGVGGRWPSARDSALEEINLGTGKSLFHCLND